MTDPAMNDWDVVMDAVQWHEYRSQDLRRAKAQSALARLQARMKALEGAGRGLVKLETKTYSSETDWNAAVGLAISKMRRALADEGGNP